MIDGRNEMASQVTRERGPSIILSFKNDMDIFCSMRMKLLKKIIGFAENFVTDDLQSYIGRIDQNLEWPKQRNFLKSRRYWSVSKILKTKNLILKSLKNLFRFFKRKNVVHRLREKFQQVCKLVKEISLAFCDVFWSMESALVRFWHRTAEECSRKLIRANE